MSRFSGAARSAGAATSHLSAIGVSAETVHARTSRTWSHRSRDVVAALIAAALLLLAAIVPAASVAATLSPACASINNGDSLAAASAFPPTLSGTYAIGVPATPTDQLASANYNNYNLSFNPGEIISYSFDQGTGTAYRMAILQSRSTYLTRPGSLENGTGALSGTITVVAADDFLTVGIFNYTTNTDAGTTGRAQPARANSSSILTISCAAPAAAPTVTALSPTSGPEAGGTSVTITGTGFTGASAVNFGAAAATGFTVNSATSISATAPAGSSAVDVTVTTPGGTSATSANDQFTYIAAPTVTGLNKTSGPAAGGTFLTISGTGFTGATAVKFGATSGTGITVVSDTSITVTAPAGSGTVDVTVTTPSGTSATSASDQYTYIAAPTVTSISPTSGPAAGGTSVTITGTGFTGATAVKFGATSGTGITVVSATSITVTAPAGSGTVDVTVTTPGGTSATSAADQFTYTAAPTVTSISPASGREVGGTSVTITGTGFSGTTAVNFGATAATGFTVNSATSITATSPAGTGTVDVRVTTGGGTSATSASDQFTYVVAPTITSISPSSGPAAGGTTVTIIGANFNSLRLSVKFGATNATGFVFNSSNSITVTAPAGSAGTVDVTVTTPNGTSAISASDQFTYIAAPTVTSISPNSGSTLGGAVVTISGTGFTGATAVKFGATAATGITVVSATQITATAPAGSAGAVDVTVTTPGGTSATSVGDQFIYIAPPMLRTWVSRSGSDANACTRSAPCLTFAGAFANTLAGGEINCLDSADYGAVTITRAVAIVCDTAKAHIRVSSSDGIVVNAGASDAVTLSGLDIAADPTNTTFSGIRLLSAGSLTIADTQLRGFVGANYAVTIVPTAPLVSVLLDRVSVASSTASTAGGLLVSPASGGTARVSILHSRFDGSAGTGVRFDSVGKTGVTIAALIDDTLFASNNVALLAKAPVGTGTISLTVLGTSFSRNSYGATINGAVTALFGDSTIATNGTGLAVMGGAVVRSAGDNRLGGNTIDGAFTAPAPRR